MASKKHDATQQKRRNAERPPRGLSAEEALRYWSDPAAYAGMMEYFDSAERMTNTPEGRARWREYHVRRNELETAFLDQLHHGRVFASGIPKYGMREIIQPDLWALLSIEYDADTIGGSGRVYEVAEFFEPSAVPLSILDIPNWFARMYGSVEAGEGSRRKELRYDAGFKHVTLNGRDFALGDQQAKVIRFLHQKSTAGEPWQHIKPIRTAAGITRMRDTFGKPEHWSHLIRSDKKGNYRLRDEDD